MLHHKKDRNKSYSY